MTDKAQRTHRRPRHSMPQFGCHALEAARLMDVYQDRTQYLDGIRRF